MAKIAKISGQVRTELDVALQQTGNDYHKNNAVLSKSMRKDAKFNRWLTSNGKVGGVIGSTEKAISKLLDDVGGNWSEVKAKQALIIKMLDANLDEVVAAKGADLTDGIVMTEEQKAAHAVVLAKFSETLHKQARLNLIQIGLEFGVVEIVDEVAKTMSAVREPALAVSE